MIFFDLKNIEDLSNNIEDSYEEIQFKMSKYLVKSHRRCI